MYLLMIFKKISNLHHSFISLRVPGLLVADDASVKCERETATDSTSNSTSLPEDTALRDKLNNMSIDDANGDSSDKNCEQQLGTVTASSSSSSSCNGGSTNSNNSADGSVDQPSGGVMLGGEEYVVVGVAIVVVRLIVEYAECAVTLHMASQSLLAGLADLLKRYNSDTCR